MTNETQAADASAAPVTSKKSEPEINTAKMDDGTLVEFGVKQKLKKTITIKEDSQDVIVRLDFVNGEFRVCHLPNSLILKAAAHGLSQKLGDQIAGIKELDDSIVAVDDLMDQLAKGDWNTPRETSGLAGASVLQKALMQLTGKDLHGVRAFLATQSPAAKTALRQNSRLKPIIEALEAEKAKRSKKKSDTVDSDALLDSLSGHEQAEASAEAGSGEPEAEASAA